MKTKILTVIIFTLLVITMFIQQRNFAMRLSVCQAELNEYRQNKLLVLKKAKNYHGVLWAYWEGGEFRFINVKGVPCKLFREVK